MRFDVGLASLWCWLLLPRVFPIFSRTCWCS